MRQPPSSSAIVLASLDLAKTVGWAVGRIVDAKPICGAWRLPASDSLDVLAARIAALENTLGPWLDDEQIGVLVMAEPFRAKNTFEAEANAGLRGIVRSECWRRDIPVLWQPESTVRKEVLGKGRAPTDQMKALVMQWCARRDIHAIDHNAADAAVLWTWTAAEMLRQRRRAA